MGRVRGPSQEPGGDQGVERLSNLREVIPDVLGQAFADEECPWMPIEEQQQIEVARAAQAPDPVEEVPDLLRRHGRSGYYRTSFLESTRRISPGAPTRSTRWVRSRGLPLPERLDLPLRHSSHPSQERLHLPLRRAISQDELPGFRLRDVSDPVVQTGRAPPGDRETAERHPPASLEFGERLASRLHAVAPLAHCRARRGVASGEAWVSFVRSKVRTVRCNVSTPRLPASNGR